MNSFKRPFSALTVILLGIFFFGISQAADISGVVFDANGKTVPNATVAVTGAVEEVSATGEKVRHVTRTDGAGRFVLKDVPPGWYGATATCPNVGAAFFPRLLVQDSNPSDVVTLRMAQEQVTQEGSVSASSGALPGRLFVIAERFSNDVGDVFYGEIRNGRYQIALTPGHYAFVVKGGIWSSTVREVVVSPRSEHVDVVLYREHGTEPQMAVQILSMVADDQNIRNLSAKNPSDQSLIEKTREIDVRNERQLKGLIEEKGWPTFDLVGEKASVAAWTLVQHGSPEFLKASLVEMRAAADRGELSKDALAFSIDRDRVYDGKKQIYGTQFRVNSEGREEPYPIEDKANLDKLRASVGLGPFSEYESKMINLRDSDTHDVGR